MIRKTTVTKGNDPKRAWHLIDLSNQTLGRACTQIAALLMGKGKTDFTYNQDAGDYVVAINAGKIQVTGNKHTQKEYHHYSGYAGGLKTLTFDEMMGKDPREVILHGVAGMLPKNKLRDARLTRLKVFVDGEHPYSDKLGKN